MKREDFVFDHMDDEYEDYWFKVVGDTKDELIKKYMEMCMVSVTEVVYSNKEQVLGVKRLFPFNYDVIMPDDTELKDMFAIRQARFAGSQLFLARIASNARKCRIGEQC